MSDKKSVISFIKGNKKKVAALMLLAGVILLDKLALLPQWAMIRRMRLFDHGSRRRRQDCQRRCAASRR